MRQRLTARKGLRLRAAAVYTRFSIQRAAVASYSVFPRLPTLDHNVSPAHPSFAVRLHGRFGRFMNRRATKRATLRYVQSRAVRRPSLSLLASSLPQWRVWIDRVASSNVIHFHNPRTVVNSSASVTRVRSCRRIMRLSVQTVPSTDVCDTDNSVCPDCLDPLGLCNCSWQIMQLDASYSIYTTLNDDLNKPSPLTSSAPPGSLSYYDFHEVHIRLTHYYLSSYLAQWLVDNFRNKILLVLYLLVFRCLIFFPI